MTTVISAENVGKKYLLDRRSERKGCDLRDALYDGVKGLGRRLRHPFRPGSCDTGSLREDFWALRDVAFEIKEGERVGIIGRNGAGKSTLLKILSRITAPTTGAVRIKGRVASLLEVGTGFHPELSGRENIFLNGALLGMSRAEIRRKFDQIVAFAEVEKFLETPVKRYSSGMYVRLAFAVAAHLEPEILIVDEVLAVGDAQFQKKCLGKMEDVSAEEGRTVLFVSHNMMAIESLCSRGLLLSGGRVAFEGSAHDAIARYERSCNDASALQIAQRRDRLGSQAVKCVGLRIMNDAGIETGIVKMGSSFRVELTLRGEFQDAIVGVLIGDLYRNQMIRGYTHESSTERINIRGETIVCCRFRDFPMMHGSYNIHVWVGRPDDVADHVENAAELVVEPVDFYRTGRMLDPHGGVAFCRTDWEIRHKGAGTSL